jgi:tRNA A-37 threonylcarbamoyl transferase component Bud32
MDLRDHLEQTLGMTYAIERELGGGGMSRVFVAEERRLNRKVVIKVLSAELSAGVNADRFEREIQLAASLQQANIVPILAAGETAGMPFYTMPFVEGESLRARLGKEGPLSVQMVQGVLRDVAKALAYAHERGVVHRDIKPDNVLLSGGTAVVTDFGIGTSIGTPAYMSPEQAAGDPTVDHRADVYSLGCMAYELLTGQPPFHGRTPARTLAAHMTEAPTPLSEARPDTPPALAQLVTQCLEKEPSARPQSGSAIVHALDSMTSTGVLTVPEILRASPMMVRRSLAVYAAAVVVVAIVARAAVIALGLPDWVFPGAVLVMLLGLPVILFTWYVNRTMRRLATSTAPQTLGGTTARHSTMTALAVKASPHVSWRRAWMGGAAALGAFVLLVAGFMVLRALGIGPAGSLLAAGKLSDRERLIVTEFQSPDTSLSTLVTEAVRTNLGQSRVVSIMQPTAIAGALRRMQLPPSSRLDLPLAREIAQREGVKAIVDGAIRSIGGGYVVSLRLLSADSANELAAFQQTANGPRELLETIDEITRKLRGKMGESLRDVRGSPPLEQVTTPSLEALRIYAEAARSMDMGGSPIEGAERLREAVRIDTAFAMAWRKLGVALSNTGLARVRVDSALERAYRFRERLTERERLLAEGTYYHLGPGRDRRRAIQAYERLLAIDPTEAGIVVQEPDRGGSRNRHALHEPVERSLQQRKAGRGREARRGVPATVSAVDLGDDRAAAFPLSTRSARLDGAGIQSLRLRLQSHPQGQRCWRTGNAVASPRPRKRHLSLRQTGAGPRSIVGWRAAPADQRLVEQLLGRSRVLRRHHPCDSADGRDARENRHPPAALRRSSRPRCRRLLCECRTATARALDPRPVRSRHSGQRRTAARPPRSQRDSGRHCRCRGAL